MSDLERLKGSIPPVVTPFRDGDVDFDAYAGLVDFQITEGSHGVLVNGTTAEPSTLTISERNRLVDIAVESANGKVPVVAATGSQSLAETEVLTEHAVQAGVDALLIVTPYYIRPQAPIVIMGNDNSSSPTKTLKSLPSAAKHSVTKPRSLTACFMPTKCADFSRNSHIVSRVTLTAVRPGM
jgi:hypothetical protein